MKNKLTATDSLFAICIRNDDYPASLEVRKLYQVVPDPAARQDYLRVIDESGEDYLYLKSYFFLLELPQSLKETLLLVGAALFALGLLSWSGGRQGVVGYMGGFLAQMFGVTAWLVPAALVMAAAVLFVGTRQGSRWLSPLMPLGLTMLLLGAMGFTHLFADGQQAAEVGQGGGYL